MLFFERSVNRLRAQSVLLSCLSVNLLFVSFSTLAAKAQVSGTIVNITANSFAMRCFDLTIATPYARGVLEWTSTFVGPPDPDPEGVPYPIPEAIMDVDMVRYDVSAKQNFAVAFNSASRSGYEVKDFQVTAIYPGVSGSFKGNVSYVTNGINPTPPPKSDQIICKTPINDGLAYDNDGNPFDSSITYGEADKLYGVTAIGYATNSDQPLLQTFTIRAPFSGVFNRLLLDSQKGGGDFVGFLSSDYQGQLTRENNIRSIGGYVGDERVSGGIIAVTPLDGGEPVEGDPIIPGFDGISSTTISRRR